MESAVFQLKVETPEFEEDYPNQRDEYRVQKLVESLQDFVFRVVDDQCPNTEEEDVVMYGLAMKLLERFQGNAQHKLLAKRLSER